MKRFSLSRLALAMLGWPSPASRPGGRWRVPALALATLPAVALPPDPTEVVGRHPDGRIVTAGDLDLANAGLQAGLAEPPERDYRDFVFAPGTDLERAWFGGARLEGADLRSTRCAEANFQGVDLRFTQVEGAVMDHAVLSGAHIWAEDADGPFKGAILAGVNRHRKAGAPPEGGAGALLPLASASRMSPKDLLDRAGLTYARIDRHMNPNGRGGNSWRTLNGLHESMDGYARMKSALKALLAARTHLHGVTAEMIIAAIPRAKAAGTQRPARGRQAPAPRAKPGKPSPPPAAMPGPTAGAAPGPLPPSAPLAPAPGLGLLPLAPPEGPEETPLPWTVVGVRWNGLPVHYQDLRPRADLRWVTFLTDLEHHWRGAPFSRTLLGGAVLRGLDCRDADFAHCDLRWTDLEGTRLEGAAFDHALVGAEQARMLERQGADLRRARIVLEEPAAPSAQPPEHKGGGGNAVDLVAQSGLSHSEIGRLAFPGWDKASWSSRIRKELAGEFHFREPNRSLFENALRTLLGPDGRQGVTAEQIIGALKPRTGRKPRAAGAAPDAPVPLQPWNVLGVRPGGEPVFLRDLRPGANLRQIFFYGDLPRSWEGAGFRPSAPAGADRARPDCAGADFSGSDLRLADVAGINVEGARFDDALVYLHQAETLLAQGADLRTARLEGLGPRSALRRSGILDGLPMAPGRPAPAALEEKAQAGPDRLDEAGLDPALDFSELNAVVDDLLRAR